MKEEVDRRSFFSRIFGGAAAIVVAPHIKTKPRLEFATLKGVATLAPLQERFHVALSNSPALLKSMTTPGDFNELVGYTSEFLETENSTQDGFGVTGEREPFGATISGCPKGYY
jgi:hypothetical protein